MTNRFMHGWTPLRQSHLLSIPVSAWRCFLCLPLTVAVVACIPVPLLSADTLTFLVLPSNKRRGMSGGLLPFLKQTPMNSSQWEIPPPSNNRKSPPTLLQWGHCSTVQVNSVAVWISSVFTHSSLSSHFEVHSQESASHGKLHTGRFSSLDSLWTPLRCGGSVL